MHSDRSDHRMISLILTATKVLALIVLRRLTPVRDSVVYGQQAGFPTGRRRIDEIFIFHYLLWTRHILSIDNRSFSRVERYLRFSGLNGAIQQKGVHEKFVNAVLKLYLHALDRVKPYGELSSPLETAGVFILV